MNTHGLEVIRTQAGDGGWTLHALELVDDDGASLVLARGTGELQADKFGDLEWDRPNQADYDRAEKCRHEIQEMRSEEWK